MDMVEGVLAQVAYSVLTARGVRVVNAAAGSGGRKLAGTAVTK